MALDFTTDPGGLFPRIGRILHVAYLLTPYEASLPGAFNAIDAQYQSTLQDVGGAVATQADSMVRVASGVMGFASTAAQNTILEMVQADVPSQARSFPSAMAEVIRQMKLQTKTVQANVIGTSQVVLTGSVGTGILVVSTKRGDGLVQENTIAEVLRVVCTADSYTGGATVGQEQFSLTGAGALAGTWDYDFPSGSGASGAVRAVASDQDGNSTTNLLTNGDFESWSGTSPGPTATLDNWALDGSSAWGTDIQQNAVNPQTGSYCVEFLPGTGVNSILYQVFGDATVGTQPVPSGLYSYAVIIWMRRVGSVSAGVLTIELTDDTGTVLADAQAVNNSSAITCSGLTTSYVAHTAVFRVNATPPSEIRYRFRMSTALVGGSVLIDNACYAGLNAMYAGGPGYALFSGATPFVGGDGWNVTNTNDQGGVSYLGTFQTGFQRLFGMTTLTQGGFLLPSSGSPNIANTLISS